MKPRLTHLLGLTLVLAGTGAVAVALADNGGVNDNSAYSKKLRKTYDNSRYITDSLDSFPQFVPGDLATVLQGRAFFGLGPGNTIDNTLGGLFEGNSAIAGPVVSNGTVCATCHRPDFHFMLPPPPLSAHVPTSDTLFTARNAEAQGDPRQADLFDNHGLVKQRMNRFNPLLRHPKAGLEPDAYHAAYAKVFAWRKTQTIVNVAFGFGYLTDGRARSLIEQGRGAAFTHTQDTDDRFDDLVNPKLNAIAAWQDTQIQPPELVDLLDPDAPLHDILVDDPFYTVHATTPAEVKGQQVFEDKCMSCHNMPNVFGNRDHIPAPPGNFPPLYGKTFDVGVAQRNRWDLDVRAYDVATNSYSPVTISLAREDGSRVNLTVVDDVGAAGTTGRYEDLHRFKVPQLRGIRNFAPYFHDNSANSLEEVVDYFNSAQYNNSLDGKTHPIHMNAKERADLLAFLQIL